MPSLIMQRAQPKLPGVLATSTGSAGSPKVDPQFCFSCEKVFPNQERLEEHTCPAASHICSCGTEFPLYVDMLLHSTTHEPGHQILDHRIIKKRRFEKYQEVEEKLRRLESVRHGLTNVPRLGAVPKASFTMNTNVHAHIASPVVPHVSKQAADISKLSKLLPNPAKSTAGTRDSVFDSTVAPTVDLWTLYHPVVLVKAGSNIALTRPYSCGKCGECFVTKKSLVAHHSLHAVDKVAGCVGCGLLLSSRKMVPRLHQCNVLSSSPKLRLITAKPPIQVNLTKAATNSHRSLGVFGSPRISRGGHFSPSSRVSVTNRSTPDRSIHRLHVASAQQLKSHNPGASNKSSQGFHTSVSPQWRRPYPSLFAKKDLALHIGAPQQVKKSIISAPDACNNRALEPAGPNGFTCRVCHISFLTSQLLQRHKCVKAQEFMVKHRQASKQANRYRKVAPASSPNIHVNGERKLGAPASGNIKTNQVAGVVVDRENGVFNNINGKPGADLDDDDCFIVESNPAKPAEMIYQVTSSLPVKT
ncbi:uncharacterized protein LOC143008815 [Genypterus blacodes]|uniref:uncharacterized protein LOC143008815 n=1 Tax=Genypterus blacodes TaxID=154954 RepID=UPI003F770DF8